MVPLIRRLPGMRRDERGSELVEAALTFPLLLLVVMGILDFGLMFQQYEVITNAAREGARIAVLPNYSAADAQQRAQDYIDASFLGSTPPTVAAPTYGTETIGATCVQTATMTITYPHEYLFVGPVAAFFDNPSLGTTTLVATSTMRMETPGVACP